MGVWIETSVRYTKDDDGVVTPCVGVWIETILFFNTINYTFVTPCVGVWIETKRYKWYKRTGKSHTLRGCVDWNYPIWCITRSVGRSHPAWVCGLKLSFQRRYLSKKCHTLRGCVDWNLLIWPMMVFRKMGHTLRGCVDWNIPNTFRLERSPVTPCVGVWIETISSSSDINFSLSHPAWVCGLKQVYI